MSALWKVEVDGQVRLARGELEAGPGELLGPEMSLDDLLSDRGRLERALGSPSISDLPEKAVVLPPIGSQEVWAAGVTYRRSLEARNEEAGEQNFYDKIYDADRPELFFKCAPSRVRGDGQTITIRPDSVWNVPEPELGLVVDASGTLAGCGHR